MASFLNRAARFEKFQSIMQELQNPQKPQSQSNPAQLLTRLYNGFTSEFSKAEAEITRLRNANDALAEEIALLKKGLDIEVK